MPALWRGGGVIFGPQPRTRQLKVAKGVKTKVLGALLQDFLTQKKVLSLDWTPKNDKPQTAALFNFLKKAGLAKKKILFFLPMQDVTTYASLRNIPNVRLAFFDQPNAFDLARSDYWVFFKKDFDQFKDMVLRWA